VNPGSRRRFRVYTQSAVLDAFPRVHADAVTNAVVSPIFISVRAQSRQ
jgi:hypothetical protein